MENAVKSNPDAAAIAKPKPQRLPRYAPVAVVIWVLTAALLAVCVVWSSIM